MRDFGKGGRSLDAVWERDDLTTGEKAVLCQIGAFQDPLAKSFTMPVQISRKRICERTSLSGTGVRRILKQLEQKGLLIIMHQQTRDGGSDSSSYRLSHKLFSDYARNMVRAIQS